MALGAGNLCKEELKKRLTAVLRYAIMPESTSESVTDPPAIDWDVLYAAAKAAREMAHAPYSRFRVGAALLAEDGTVIRGCNVENRSYGLSICAERTAVAAAVAAGKRRFRAIAVVTDASPPAMPCGMCRETLNEFAENDLPVLVANLDGERRETRLRELHPMPFEFSG